MADVFINTGAVTLGAMIGGPARFFLSGFIAHRVGETFPWGTLVVNVSGAFLMGLIGGYAIAYDLPGQAPLWLLLATGVLGSYTTVSSFSLQTRALARDGEPLHALGYVGISLGFCLAAVVAGFTLATAILGRAFS